MEMAQLRSRNQSSNRFSFRGLSLSRDYHAKKPQLTQVFEPNHLSAVSYVRIHERAIDGSKIITGGFTAAKSRRKDFLKRACNLKDRGGRSCPGHPIIHFNLIMHSALSSPGMFVAQQFVAGLKTMSNRQIKPGLGAKTPGERSGAEFPRTSPGYCRHGPGARPGRTSFKSPAQPAGQGLR